MQGCIILAITGTEELIVTEVEGQTDGMMDGQTERDTCIKRVFWPPYEVKK